MAGPITWRNVNSDNNSGQSRALLGAGQAIGGGANALMDAIAQQQKIQQANQKVQVGNNTQDFLDKVASLPGGAAALADPTQQAGLESLRQSYGNQIDREATRGAVASQLGALQGQELNTIKYGDTTQEVAQRPLVDKLQELQAAGDTAGVDKILNENQFRDEGALRGQLAGVQDTLQQRQYRASAEGRAQAGESRAQASHALSQAAGNENLQFNKAMHTDSLNKLRDNNMAEGIALNVQEDYQNGRQALTTALGSFAKDKGYLLDADGTISTKGMDDTAKQKLKTDMQQADLPANVSESDAKQAVVARAKAAGLGPTGINTAVKQWELTKTFDTLAPEDQKAVATAADAAIAPIDAAKAKLNAEYTTKATGNPFVAPPTDVPSETASLLDFVQKDGFDPWGSNNKARQNYTLKVNQLLSDGMTVKDNNGKEMNVVVPPSMIKAAVQANRDNSSFFFFDDGKLIGGETGLEDFVRSQFKDSPGLFKQATEAQDLRDGHAKKIAELDRQALTARSKIVRQAEKEKGGTVNLSDYVNALKRRE